MKNDNEMKGQGKSFIVHKVVISQNDYMMQVCLQQNWIYYQLTSWQY